MGNALPPDQEELHRRVDEVLHYVWDPIGISGIPEARDEYHSYLPLVFSRLIQNASAQEIADFLSWVASDRMGLESNPAHSLAVANILVDWKEHLLSSSA